MRIRPRRSAHLFLTAALLTGLTSRPALAAPADATALPRTVSLPEGLQPEGITSSGHRYFVGSLNDGRIVTGDLRGGATAVLLPGAEGRQLRGLQFDRSTGLLWAVGNVGSVAHVWAVSVPSGSVVSDTVVPGGVFLNDLVVTDDAVWVTDSKVERLTRIALDQRRPTGSAPTFLSLGGQWPGSVEDPDTGTAGNSANGIRLLDAGHVVLDHGTAGGLWSVNLASGLATAIPIRGGAAITGGDGLERHGSTLWVVRGTSDTSASRLRLIEQHGRWSARWVTQLTDPSLDVPSTATFTLGTLWAVNARFGNPSPTTAPYYITRLG